MGTLGYIARRIAFGLLPQLIAVSVVTFCILRVIPGDPAGVLLGPNATRESIDALRSSMGLDDPVHVQYLRYVGNLLQGDLGRSWFSREPVLDNLIERAPATLELITYALLVALVVGVAVGALSAAREGTRFGTATAWLTQTAGSFPDFWIALIGIFVFFHLLGWAPAPLGRIDLAVLPPTRITGFYTIDSLLTGDVAALRSSAAHLILPVLSLGLILSITVAKTARASMLEVLQSDYIRYARANGLMSSRIYRSAIRNAAPPIVTLIGVLMAYLLGGAVLIEKVFSWGGVGEYAVTAVSNADFAPIQAFLLVTATFTMVVYLVVDVIQRAIDPRLRAR
jgi:ABC-type dipeptide/oligopeptide/nickel transport system permease component